MEWAKDQLGKPVRASVQAPFSIQLYCGCCGARVYLRAGPERRAHFAHYGHGGGKDCDVYYPSQSLPPSVVVAKPSTHLVKRLSALRAGLFLERPDAGDWRLHIKFPARASAELGGRIEIQSAYGTKKLTAPELQRTRLVPVQLAVPVAVVQGWEDLEAEATEITKRIHLFGRIRNYFYAGDRGGNLIPPEEALEEGGRYRLVTQERLKASIPSGIEVTSFGRQGDWHLYEIHLLHRAPVATKELEVFLGRAVAPQRGRVDLIDPPHHVDVDGAFVYPEGTEQILVHRTGSAPLVARDIDQTMAFADLGEGWFVLQGMRLGEVLISLGSRDVCCVRIERCELFSPVGIMVRAGAEAWDLFASELPEAIRNRDVFVRIECPSDSVADMTTVGSGYQRLGTAFEPVGSPQTLEVDSGNFGSLAIRLVPEPASLDPIKSDYSVEAWIAGILASSADRPHGSSGNYFVNSSARSKVVDSQIAWLRLHLPRERQR